MDDKNRCGMAHKDSKLVMNLHSSKAWMRNVMTEGFLSWGIFFLPFLLGGVSISGNMIIILYALVLIFAILLLQAQEWRSLWRRRSYLPNMLLFLSTAGPLWSGSHYLPLWSGVALLLGLLWRCGIHYFLGRQLVTKIFWMLKPLRLLLASSLLYAVLLLLLSFTGVEVLDSLWWSSYIPTLLIFLLLVFFVWQMWRVRSVEKGFTFDCPKDAAIVRLAIVQEDQIWLTRHGYTGCQVESHNSNEKTICYDSTGMDQPITSCVHPDEQPSEALARAMRQSGLAGLGNMSCVASYKYNDAEGRRTVHLFLLRLRTGEEGKLEHLRGRFFTPYEVDELMALNQFSNLLLGEYQFIHRLWERSHEGR